METVNEASTDKKRKKVLELTDKQRERFDKCWNVYPRKVNKGEAELSWAQLDPNDELTEKIYNSILDQNRDRGTKFISKEDKKFIKHFSSWLRAKGWVYESENDGELVSLKRSEKICACGGKVWSTHEGKPICAKCYDAIFHSDFNKKVYENLCKHGLGKLKDETKEQWMERIKQAGRRGLKKVAQR